ncbi:LamG-like jellyroll fold domain-containing protein [Nonomuraea sp. NPDC049400]|uniref:LamG-like jellyroll fold domain-containing protein n=1 Tax=Nonomuraea sp. NPDC049400 TaxID=3364352 RepID=UPI00378DC2AF
MFDSSGRLLKVTDQRGRSQNLEYGSDGKLAKAIAPGGRSLTFTWSGAHVETVMTDPVDGKALTWSYSYNGDVLEKVCNPAQECTVYSHNPGSLYRSTVLDSDPMGYWRLGETSGTSAKGLGWLGNASYSGITLGQPGALAGTPDTAVGIPASSTSAIHLPNGIIPRAGAWASIEAWFKTGASGTVMTVQGEYSYITFPMLQVTADGKLAAGYDAASRIVTTAVVKDDAWHHAVLTAAGDRQTLYVDGVAAGTFAGTIPNTTPLYADHIYLGGVSGTIDEVAVYDRPLSPAEVARHYAARAEALHKLTKITLPSGRIWAANTYDTSTDRIKAHTDSDGGTWQLGDLTYDSTTGMSTVTVTDPNNASLSSVHDAWRGYHLVSHTDQLGKKMTYSYDTGGFLQTITDPNLNTVTTYNDARGNVIQRRTCRTTSSCQTVRTEYYLNSNDLFDQRNDRVLKVRDARSASATDNTYATSFEYDSYGEQTKQTTPATSDFPNGRSATVAYTDGSEPAIGGGSTPAGLVKTRTDAKGNTTSFGYNAAGDLAEQTDPAGLVTKLEHDALGRVTARTQVSDAEPGGVKIMLTYDELGRVATETTPGVKNEITGVVHTAKTSYTYDADGNTLTATVTDLTGGDPERTTTYTYDVYGYQESVTDPEGGVIRTTWNKLGLQATVADQLGSVFGYAYTERGQLAAKTLKNWTGSPVNPQPAKEITLESYSYDPAGRLSAQVDAMGRKTSYTYYTDNLLSQVIGDDVKLNGSATAKDVVLAANTYDAAGNLTQRVIGADIITGAGIATTAYVYDAANRLASETFDPAKLARKTAYTYDANNNIATTTRSAAGSSRTETTAYAYNKQNILTQSTVKNDGQDLTRSWTIDDRGLVESLVDPRGNLTGADPNAYTTSYRYDTAGRLVERKAPTVQIEKNGTAQAGRPTTRFGYDTVGHQTQTVDAEERLTTSSFDRAGRLASVTGTPYTPPGGTAVTPKTSHAYDAAGRLIKTTDGRGNATSIEYDALDNAVRVTDPPASPGQPAGQWVTEFDLLGEELATVDPTGARSEATYDDLGRQITRTIVERKPTAAAYTTNLQYNDAGDLTKVILPGNKATAYTVNAAGEVTAETDPMSNTTTYGYDIAGRPAKVTDAEGNGTAADYDPAGRLTSLKNLDKTGTTVRTVGYGYDAADNLTQITSGEGHITRRTFDASDLLTELIEPVSATKSITTSFGYDATGARTRFTDGRGNATWTSYNALGLIETLTEPATTAHPNLADRTWTHIYDAASNETALIKPGGVRLDRQYDALNRLTKVSGSGAGIVAEDKTYGYDLADRATTVGDHTLEYNDRSLLAKVSTPSGPSTSFAYDALGNPTQRIDMTGTTTYTWDNANRLRTVADPVSGRTNTYDYDKANRLTTITSANPANTQAYTYDALDRPLTQTLKNSSSGELAKITYGWDKDDNLTTKTTSGLAGAGTNTYGYDHAGRLTSWTAPNSTTTSYEWDDSGNRTKVGDKAYSYDERNRLTSGDGADYTYTPRGTLASQTKNGTTRHLTFDTFDRLLNDGDATYTYDAFDRLSSRQTASGRQRFVYAGLDNDIIAITDQNGAVQSSYGRDPFGSLVSVKDGANPALGALTDLHQDLIGTFSGTALAASTAYTPFGEVTAQTGTKTSLGYQSEYTDPDTGTVNMHARWYQPGTGAFTSRDDWTLPSNPSAQANRYTYGNASPLIYRDPTGHIPSGPGCSTNDWYYQQTSARRGGSPGSGGCNSSDGDTGARDLNRPGGSDIDVEKTERHVPNPAHGRGRGRGRGTGQPASGSATASAEGPSVPKRKRSDGSKNPNQGDPKKGGPKKPKKGTHRPAGPDVIEVHDGGIAPIGSGGPTTSNTVLPVGGTPTGSTPTVTPVDLPEISGGSPPPPSPEGTPIDWLTGVINGVMGTPQLPVCTHGESPYMTGDMDTGELVEPTCTDPLIGDPNSSAWKSGYDFGAPDPCALDREHPVDSALCAGEMLGSIEGPGGIGRLGPRPKTDGKNFPDRPLPRDEHGGPKADSDYPHTQLGWKKGRRDKYPQAREFGYDGEVMRDYDFSDHGRPEVPGHENPHQHRYEENPTGGYKKRGPAEPWGW